MADQQVAVHPITEGSFYPDLDEAIASCCGETFDYQLCEERLLETPSAGEIHEFLGEYIADNSALLESDMAWETASRCGAAVSALAGALVKHALTAWYPVGEVLTYTPPPIEPDCDRCDDTGFYQYDGSPELCSCPAGAASLAAARTAVSAERKATS